MTNLIDLIKQARLIFLAGNGGSAATAEHFSNDLIKKGYPAICLSSNVSAITMIANDYGYEQIFSKQLEVYGDKKDLLITISCSGTSKNILEAIRTAVIKKGMKIYAFETFNKDRDFGQLENKHLIFAHDVIEQL